MKKKSKTFYWMLLSAITWFMIWEIYTISYVHEKIPPTEIGEEFGWGPPLAMLAIVGFSIVIGFSKQSSAA